MVLFGVEVVQLPDALAGGILRAPDGDLTTFLATPQLSGTA